MNENQNILEIPGINEKNVHVDEILTNQKNDSIPKRGKWFSFNINNNKEHLSKQETLQIHEINEHLKSVQEVSVEYKTRIDSSRPQRSLGLSADEAQAYLLQNGPNCITPPPKKSLILLFISHFGNLFNVLLLISGGLSFILYAIDRSQMVNLLLGAVLLFVATMNSSIEFYQEFKSAEILSSFMSLVPPMCIVIRDGNASEINAKDVVIGDILSLKSGDKIPADVRIIQANDFKVDNSSITGESEAQERFPGAVLEGGHLEASNLAFSGTMAVSGEALGIVIRTGDESVLGQIAKLTCSHEERPSQMSKEIDLFVKKIALVASVLAVFFFIYGLVMNYGIGITFSFAIGLFVAFVPQGIPATVTLLLTIAAKRLSKKNVLVKDLQGVETLGAITLLATDKTGTLTQNKMSVVGSWINGKMLSATGKIESNVDGLLIDSTPNLSALIDACSLCTKAKFDPKDHDKPIEERNVFGDATEAGLLRFAANFLNVTENMDEHYKVFEIPFNSASKWHLTANVLEHSQGDLTLFLKGAPERVAGLCKFIQVDECQVPWTEETTESFNRAYECFAGRGQRVLAFARRQLPREEFPVDFQFKKEKPRNFPDDDFVFLGLISLMDPPKKGVKKAVAACRTAGIQVVMITGDHPLTAEAIARKIGLIQGETAAEVAIRSKIPIQLVEEDQYDALVIHGDRLDSFTDEDWDRALCKREIVFARTSPKHKLEIVTRFQSKGHIVGVSGDGVNDSPALKKADLGISMNKTASDVSKESAAMILLDDNFASIVTGIAEGRLIFANLKKSIRYTLTHSTPEISAFIIFVILGIPAPISSILVLLIDLGTELGPAISYAFEVPEGDLMLVPPRKVLTTDKKPRTKRKRASLFERIVLRPTTTNETEIDNQVTTIIVPLNDMIWYKRWMIKTRAFFIQDYTGETLIDNDLLVWCYFQGGLFEAIGCFSAYLAILVIERVPLGNLYQSALVYFKETSPNLLLTNGTFATAADQLNILAKAQAAFFLSIVICQWFNIFIQKHRFSYPYGRDMLKNKWTWVGIGVGVIISVFIIYIPFINFHVFGALPFSPLVILCPIIMGLSLFAYEFIRRYLRRKGYFGGIPKRNVNLVDLVRTTSSVKFN